VFPVHFKSKLNYNDGTFEHRNLPATCSSTDLTLQKQKNLLALNMAIKYNFGYIYTFHLLEEGWDLHFGSIPDSKIDCVHYLTSPEVWEPIFQSIYNEIFCYQAKPNFFLV